MAILARGTIGRDTVPEKWMGIREEREGVKTCAADSALEARMRRCLILRQGASPLRPPAPFPSGSMFQIGGNLSRVRKPRNIGAPLTDCRRSEELPDMRERGLLVRRQQLHAASRWSAPRSSTIAQT